MGRNVSVIATIESFGLCGSRKNGEGIVSVFGSDRESAGKLLHVTNLMGYC